MVGATLGRAAAALEWRNSQKGRGQRATSHKNEPFPLCPLSLHLHPHLPTSSKPAARSQLHTSTMRYTTFAACAAFAASAVLAKELPKDELRAAELYDSGVVHQGIMERKTAFWEASSRAGLLDSASYPRLNYTKCVDGKAEAIKGDPLHTFRCKNMDLYDFINHAELGSPGSDAPNRVGSGSWGWTDPESGREFVANGAFQGTQFLEILPEGRLRHLGFLPSHAPDTSRSLWKELKSYQHYILISSELPGHGVQIFDLRKLLPLTDAEIPKRFGKADYTGHFNEIAEGRTHNVVVNEEGQYGVTVGNQPRDKDCLGGLIFFDLKDPANPKRIGCNKDDGYVHDAQCIIYRGPHEKYYGRDICYGYNEDSLTIYDVTDKANSKIISITSYEGASFTHQGWVNNPQWQEWLYMDDELDEQNAAGLGKDGFPVTYIWDIRDLERPRQTGFWKGTVRAIDHNQYINPHDGLMYQSNYGAGLRVYDVSSVPSDPTGASVGEVAYFDVHPEDDAEPGGGAAAFTGSWSSVARFKSGFVWINTFERGGFLVKPTRGAYVPFRPAGCSADNCLRGLRSDARLAEARGFCAGFLGDATADVAVVPAFAAAACAQGQNVISRVSSACRCLPTPTPAVAARGAAAAAVATGV
ncbi:hypothetical protein RB598_006511 [Gaeumannomyces tritici]